MIINEVKIFADPLTFERDELEKIVAECKEKIAGLKEIRITATDDGYDIDIEYKTEGVKFERIRRITGYLTGDLTTWNNAKRAEESERVKHDVE